MFMSKKIEDVKAELTSVRIAIDQINITIQTLLEMQASQILSELKQTRSELTYLQGKLNALTIEDSPNDRPFKEREPLIPVNRDPQEFSKNNRQ